MEDRQDGMVEKKEKRGVFRISLSPLLLFEAKGIKIDKKCYENSHKKNSKRDRK